MRVFRGPDGRTWEVVVGRESWGSLFAIFLPQGAGEEARQTLLPETPVEAANRALLEMGDRELLDLLEGSAPKPTE
jgi:hypothetical protein